MTASTTFTDSITFTITHARHLATKVATDLKRMQRFYASPGDADIGQYEAELVELVRGGYLGTVRYGFRRNDTWIEPMLEYRSHELAGGYLADDDPGRIRPGADVSGAKFHSYLTYSAKWHLLSTTEREAIKRTLPFQRGHGAQPALGGDLVADRTYTAGGRCLGRSSLRSLQ